MIVKEKQYNKRIKIRNLTFFKEKTKAGAETKFTGGELCNVTKVWFEQGRNLKMELKFCRGA